MTISQTISTLPAAPQRSDPPATFITKADAHVASLPTLVSQLNTFGGQVNTTQTEINASQTAASGSASAAASSASAAASSASAAQAAANFVGTWSSLTGALNKPATVLHLSVYWQLLNNLANVAASEPSLVSTDWAPIVSRLVVPLTSAATLSAVAPNELQDGSAFVVPAANSVPANWFIDVELPSAFAAFKPTLVPTGADTFLGAAGSDTEIKFLQPAAVRLTSNGSNQWRL